MRRTRILLIIIACLLVGWSPFFVMANSNDEASSSDKTTQTDGAYSEKDEVVYATLSATGEQQEMYVINSFDITEQGTMVDYGSYTNVKNLTNLLEIDHDREQVEFTAEEEQFYYQGDLDGHPLPWNFEITYRLNGKEMTPDELLGQEGSLEISIDTSANDAVDPTFFDHYLMQISVTLDSDVYRQIRAEDGTVANAGRDQQVTFTVMPEQEETLVLEALVQDFEFDGVEISALPASMSVDQPNTEEMNDELGSLADGMADLHDAVGDLLGGVQELNDGVVEWYDGSSDYQNGISELNQGSSDLIEGSEAIDRALEDMNRSLENQDGMDLSDFEELEQGLREIAEGLYDTEEGLNDLRDNYLQAYNSLDEAMNGIPSSNLSEEDIQALYMSDADSEVIDTLVETYEASMIAKGTYEEVQEAFQAVGPTLEEVTPSLNEMANQLETMADELAESIDQSNSNDGMTQLKEGISELSTNYQDFHSGLVDYTDGVGQLNDSYHSLHKGVGELSDGTIELEDGVSELHDGTEELAVETEDLPNQMQDEIDQMMNDYEGNDFEPVSFVSDQNEQIETVQFVIQTESITFEETEDDEEEFEKEDKGIWERFLDLFRS
ncbi:coiled-coil domain-containing protein [Alkalibacillus aidingensis]|uniref:YhgE/Pip domain-containing protein n=1 Tax=Alkalibacillus aidingensis TaxID=2747607 RepID=UPI00166052C7|nr:YhgE/Pip domain-containing protein [Alkalibacillus aidingensis]